jgi:putative ABC transport system permease protein
MRNHLLLILRFMQKQKGFSVINITGLTIGIICSLLLALYVYDETRYDTFHEDAQAIYRVAFQSNIRGEKLNTALSPADLAAAATVEGMSATRLVAWKTFPILYEDKSYTEKYLLLADENFFDFFSFNLIQGDKKEALKGERKIVLTESAARRYFGYAGEADSSPLGKTLILAQGYTVRVSGIAQDPPSYSHFHFSHILSLESWDELAQSSWLAPRVHTYIKVKNQSPDTLLGKLTSILHEQADQELRQTRQLSYAQFEALENSLSLSLQPLTAIHLHSRLADEIEENGNIDYVYLFLAIAIIIALLACINFINLSTARSAGRAKEVGVRKALGASTENLIKQFLIESYVYMAISVALSYLIIALVLGPFNYFTEKEIAYTLLFKPGSLVFAVALILIIGLLAGSYPSLYLTQFNPIEVLHGRLREKLRSFGVRNALVVFQFFISSALILTTLVMVEQLRYVQQLNPGFNKHNIINLLHTKNLKDQGAAFKQELLRYEGVVSASYANRLPPQLDWQANFRDVESGKDLTMTVYEMDHDHLETMNLTVVQGRFFSPEIPADTAAIILNETAMAALKWSDLSNKEIFSEYDSPDGMTRNVIGVLRDFNFRSAREPITPLAIVQGREPSWEMAIRIKEDNSDSTLAHIERLWKNYATDAPFEFRWVTQSLAEAYRSESRTGTIFLAFTLLAIFIAGLGLFGLANFIADLRTKEIGVRKVLGAGVGSIMFMLNKNFLGLVLIGNGLAFPLAAWYIQTWLRQFEYHVSLSPVYFVVTSLITLFIAFLSVSYRAVKAASANPVESLRNE